VEYSYVVRPPEEAVKAVRVPLVDREVEVGTLLKLLEESRTGPGAIALIQGEPGIGKTRLLEEALSKAGSHGFSVFRGASEEWERDRPFGAIADALGLGPDASDPRRAEIGELLKRTHGAGGAAGQGPALRYVVLEAILGLVEDLSTERPIALAVDDLHWADASTLLVVRHLGRRITTLPMVALVTSRPTPRTGELAGIFEALRAEGLIDVPLGPLSERGVIELAGSLMHVSPDPSVLAQLSGAAGNPLLVTEFVSAVADRMAQPPDRMKGPGGDFPRTFADAVLGRLRFLSAEALHFLRQASVLGSSFTAGDLALVLGRPVVELLPALDEARDSQILVEADGRLAFRHDLVREAIYTDLPTSVRKEMHAHTARTLAAAGRPAAQVATHMGIGATPGDPEAVNWLHRAGKEILEFEPKVAAKLLERARDVAGPRPEGDAILADLMIAHVWSGRTVEAEAIGEQLLAADASSAQAAQVRLFLARALLSQGRGQEGLALLEPALADTRVRGGTLTDLLAVSTILRVMVGDIEGARALGEEGVRAAQRDGDPAAEALNLVYLGMAARAAGEPSYAVDLASRAIDIGTRARSTGAQAVHTYAHGARLFIDADRMEEADSALQSGRRLAEEHGISWGRPECHSLLAERHLHVGSWDDAVAEAETTADLCETFGEWATFGIAKSILGLVAVHRNELRRAAVELASARDRLISAPGQHHRPWVRWATGLLLEAKGDDGGALQSVHQAWSDSTGIISDQAEFGPDLVRLALRMGERTLAAQATRTLEAGARKAKLPRMAGAALLCRGLLDGDAEAMLASVDAYRAITRPYDLARACELGAATLDRRGLRDEAVPHLRESLSIYEDLVATRDIARVEASLRSLGAPRGRRGRMSRPQTGWDSLTQTENAVARLVADGLRNRDIAGQLFVSRRTVETHLTHIFGKLGISSRAELIAIWSRGPGV